MAKQFLDPLLLLVALNYIHTDRISHIVTEGKRNKSKTLLSYLFHSPIYLWINELCCLHNSKYFHLIINKFIFFKRFHLTVSNITSWLRFCSFSVFITAICYETAITLLMNNQNNLHFVDICIVITDHFISKTIIEKLGKISKKSFKNI